MKIIEEKIITKGVYEYTFEDGSVLRTWVQNPQVVYDMLHPAHNTCVGGNCYLNGKLMSFKYAISKIEKSKSI